MIIAKKVHVFYNKKNKQIFFLHLEHKQGKILMCMKISKQNFLELIANNNYQLQKINETLIYFFI